MKINSAGRSKGIDSDTYEIIQRYSSIAKYKFLWAFLHHSGCRIGAALQIKKRDFFSREGLPFEIIKIAGNIQKRSRKSKPDPLIIPIAFKLQVMAIELKIFYTPGNWLFPGKNYHDPMSYSSAQYQFSKILKEARLDREGYSIHGFKRGFIQMLFQRGATKAEISQLTGNKSYQSIQYYLEDEESKISKLRRLIN